VLFEMYSEVYRNSEVSERYEGTIVLFEMYSEVYRNSEVSAAHARRG
jgi:hypothetical protein